MELAAVLLRWYRSFNIAALGPADRPPTEPWHMFREQSFPFVSVPLDRTITTIVGANESGKSHLLSAVAKAINGFGLLGLTLDSYEIKDICRYCGFSPLDEDVWPEVGLQFTVSREEAALFTQEDGDGANGIEPAQERRPITVLLHGGSAKYATVYMAGKIVRSFDRDAWHSFAKSHLPHVSVLDSSLALPNEIHIDELLDLYQNEQPRPVVEALAVQDLWREIAPIEIGPGGGADQGATQRVHTIKAKIEATTRRMALNERTLAQLLFSGILGIKRSDLQRMRAYSDKERGYVSWVNDEINVLIDRELDISRYWDQDEDFRLTVNYKAGTFHFQITDRTGSTYTFNERSSGLRYFLSYYIQAKAIEKLQHDQGVVILMDEPDSYLSASGQRSLLRVFDALVSKKTAHGACQLVYTTHSPFLINRNFPDRIRLVRKGDGSEGTQYVPKASVRRFEPVRSALSIDASDTLFLGSTNVVVEGHSDQKFLTACIQRFGAPGRLDDVLDLNTVTLVAAGGAPHAPELVRKALRGDDKPPIVVVLLDGDAPGSHFAEEAAKLIDPRQVCTLRDIDTGTMVAEVLEDIVPITLLEKALHEFLSRRGFQCVADFSDWKDGANQAERLELFLMANVPQLSGHKGSEIRFGVVDALVDLISDQDFQMPELAKLQCNAESVFRKINKMVEHAQRNAGRHSLKKLVGQRVDLFAKRFPMDASKDDVRRVLEDLKSIAFGRADDAEQTRKNADLLLDQLDREAQHNSDSILIAQWRERLKRLKNQPWAAVRDWSSVGASDLAAGPHEQPEPPSPSSTVLTTAQ